MTTPVWLTRTRKWLVLLITLLLCWIWGNSLLPVALSAKLSTAFKQAITPYYYAICDQLQSDKAVAVSTVSATETKAATAADTLSGAAPNPAPTPAKPKDIRKYAHFTEFAALAALTGLYALLGRKLRWQHIGNCLAFGLFVAVTDESLQLLSDRGPLVTDILLDFAGYNFGFSITLLLFLLLRGVQKPSSKSPAHRT